MSLFQEGTLEMDNPQSREEDEEAEEQRRRQEELTDLLATGIHAFNYDESTINSSATSFEGAEPNCSDLVNNIRYDDSGKKSSTNLPTSPLNPTGQDYRDVNHQDQLKVLYDVRVREIKKLQNEFEQYKIEKSKEIGILKNKVFLSEAEIRQVKLSLSNSENLLVEKTEIIKTLQQDAASKDQEIEKLQKIVDEMKFEICTYTSTINELQLKLSDNNPFSTEARKFQSNELQKAHQDQIIKLESLLQEQSKKTQILEKENNRLDVEMKKLIKEKKDIEEENTITIQSLSKKLLHAQEQCKVLFELGEAVKKESDHFKERMEQLEHNSKLSLSSDDFKTKKMDKETMMVHLEKLKRMLLDRNVEINAFKAKLRTYDAAMEELFEYRNLVKKMYTNDLKPCNNSEHEEMLLFMQGQIQSYQQAVDDRNNQIMNLTMIKKELQERIEEMIQKTRTDIQNLSERYSLPQLETMSNELKNAEKTIQDLKIQLEKAAIDKSKQESLIEERSKMNELIQELTEENAKLKSELEKICSKLGITEREILESDVDIHELALLKSKCGQVHDQLQQVAMHLEKSSPKRENVNLLHKLRKYMQDMSKKQDFEKTEIEEKLKLWDNILRNYIENSRNVHSSMDIKESELRDSLEDLTNAKTMLEGEKFALEYQLKSLGDQLEDANRQIKILMENKSILMKQLEGDTTTIQNLTDQINELKTRNTELEKQLEDTKKQLSDAKHETIQLQKEVREVNENIVRQNLFKELKDVENELEQSRTEDGVSGTEFFQKALQAEILKAEIMLRERIEEENIKQMQKIEEHYRKVVIQKSETYNREKDEWKKLEMQYKQQCASVLVECGNKIERLEEDNANLIKHITDLVNEYKAYRNSTASDVEKFKNQVIELRRKFEIIKHQCQKIIEGQVLANIKIQKQNNKKIQALQRVNMANEREIRLIADMYDEKIRKFKNEWKGKNRVNFN